VESTIRKVLPLAESPLTTFQVYAAIPSILLNYEESYDWLFSQYIQIYAVDKKGRGADEPSPICLCFFSDFDSRRLVNMVADYTLIHREACPYLYMYDMPFDLIKKLSGSFVSFTKHCIDNSLYTFGYVNRMLIKAYNTNNDLEHQIFIYGYDDEREIFFFCDFLDDGVYTRSECSYSELESAYQAVMNHASIPGVNSIALLT
jgi:hypothetical protein